jgi:hypothetical protein
MGRMGLVVVVEEEGEEVVGKEGALLELGRLYHRNDCIVEGSIAWHWAGIAASTNKIPHVS